MHCGNVCVYLCMYLFFFYGVETGLAYRTEDACGSRNLKANIIRRLKTMVGVGRSLGEGFGS